MDQCGFPKTAFWLHQAQWRDDIDVLQLVPHWNWPADSIGKKIKVMSLTNADSVVISLNGKKISGQKVDKYEMNAWEVAYHPGKLEAVGYRNGKIVSRFKTETTDVPKKLQLIADRGALSNDGWDAMPVTVQVLDRYGRPVPTSNIPVTFTISGDASIIGLGNGDPNSHEPEKGHQRSLFNGLAQVIIQSKEGGRGNIVLTASSDGVESGSTTISLSPAPVHPFVKP
jgi:beta-galactosidase